jgi:anti-sigma regulatory factor (Ser/Thr protein kinase)
MRELSLNVLDVAQNSIVAGADLITIAVTEDTAADRLTIVIGDNGRGMTPEQLQKVRDPFYTTRTTRKVGMGIPLFRMAAEMTGGALDIQSEAGKGTTVTAVFALSHIDRMPLGDMTGTVTALIRLNPHLDFRYIQTVDGVSFEMDTRELRDILGDVPLNDPDVMEWIGGYLKENLEPLHSKA